jgi:hypothetical protein
MPSHFATLSSSVPGLLEQPQLRVRPADDSGRRWLEDGQGHVVGFACTVRRPWWARAALAVHEAFEEPVVFRVRRLWTFLPRWRVVDADDEVVGTVGGSWLLDHWGRGVFLRRGRAYEKDGIVAAEWHDGRLILHPAVQQEPFWKMLLLASVLVGG